MLAEKASHLGSYGRDKHCYKGPIMVNVGLETQVFHNNNFMPYIR